MGKMLFVYNPRSGKGQIRSNLAAVVETFTAAYLTTAYKDVITFAILIVILAVAPNGIFKEKVIE